MRDTPVKKRAALIHKYIEDGITADFNEHFIKQHIRSGISAGIQHLKSASKKKAS